LWGATKASITKAHSSTSLATSAAMETSIIVLLHIIRFATPEVVDALVLSKSCTHDSTTIPKTALTRKTLTHFLLWLKIVINKLIKIIKSKKGITINITLKAY
jgi:hypothetical protein